MGILLDKGIVKGKKTKTEKIFEDLFAPQTFEEVQYSTPQEYIAMYWTEYKRKIAGNVSLNGNIFECVITTLLYREGLLPFYTQAKVAFVPNVEFDVLFYTPSQPICLSLKTSLRERYKQADLEAIALRYVHRKAKSFLLTLDPEEAILCKSKIKSGDIIGIDSVIDCNTEDINKLINELKEKKSEFAVSTKISIIEGNLIQ